MVQWWGHNTILQCAYLNVYIYIYIYVQLYIFVYQGKISKHLQVNTFTFNGSIVPCKGSLTGLETYGPYVKYALSGPYVKYVSREERWGGGGGGSLDQYIGQCISK